MIWFPSSQLLSSPLLKIPLLFTAAKLAALGMTPPNPPASAEEMKGYQDGKDPLRPFTPITDMYKKTSTSIYWANALCESVVILAKQFPSSLSETALAFLARDSLQAANNIRITPTWLIGCILMALGGCLRIACHRTLGKLYTWELTVKKEHTLGTSGPYSIVRHPGYVGSTMIAAGAVICQFAAGGWFAECVGWGTMPRAMLAVACVAWNVTIPVMLIFRVNTEDQVLRKKFGEQWEEYAKRTPYRLVPYLY